MKNVAHNGFGCPYCRNKMAEDLEEEEEDSDYESNFDEEEEEEEEEDEEEPVGDNEMALDGMRQLFRRVNNDIEDAAEEARTRVVTAEEMTWTLIDAGYNMTDVVKAFMINNNYHLHYPDDTTEEDEFVEKIETHMENVLHHQIPIVPRQFPIYPTSNEVEEEQEEEEEEKEKEKEEENILIEWKPWVIKCGVSRYQFENAITSFTHLMEKKSDIAQPKTINKKNMITLYDDECL
jgi:hypothetical protein